MPILLEEQLNYPLPQMHRVRQSFSRPRLEDIEAHIKQEITKKRYQRRSSPARRSPSQLAAGASKISRRS